MNINKVLYAQVTCNVLDEIEDTIGATMSGNGQLLTDIETLSNNEFELSKETQTEIDKVLKFAKDINFGGDVILYK